MSRQFSFRGRTVEIRDSVTASHSAHDMHSGQGAPAAGHAAGGHMPAGEIVIGGRTVTIYRLSDGNFFTHELPFVSHRTLEDAARALVNLAFVETPDEAGAAQAPIPRRDAPYRLKGDFLEFCDCYTICPCWVDGAPDDGTCTGAFAWLIEEGEVDGVDVSGRAVVSISTHEGHRDDAHQRVMLFIDDGAGEHQAELLSGVFTGCFGGPLDELASLLGTLLSVERTKIRVERGACSAQLGVGARISVDAVTSIGSTGKPTKLLDGRLATVLGTPAEVGVARRLRIAIAEHGIDIDVRGRSAMRGKFDYCNRP